MKYDIDDKARLVLKHIVYIAERTAKQIQFCFTKGKKQYYINSSYFNAIRYGYSALFS